MSDLTTLRAEVEQKRTEVLAENERMRQSIADYEEQLAIGSGQILAYTRVLDLIDKHAREGQPDANH